MISTPDGDRLFEEIKDMLRGHSLDVIMPLLIRLLINGFNQLQAPEQVQQFRGTLLRFAAYIDDTPMGKAGRAEVLAELLGIDSPPDDPRKMH